MGGKQKASKALVIQIGITVAVFIIALFTSVFGYVGNYQSKAGVLVNSEMSDLVEYYADEVRVGIKDCVDISAVVVNLFGNQKSADESFGEAISSLYSLGYVEDIFVIDELGKDRGMRGTDIDFSENAFWNDMNQEEGVQIIPMVSASDQNRLLVINTTIKDDEKYHIIVTYSFDRFLQSIKEDEFDTQAVYMVTSREGTVLSVNKISSKYATAANLCDALGTGSTEQQALVDGIQNGQSVYANADIGGEKRTVFVAPVGNYPVNVVVAVNDSHVKYRIKQEVKQVITLEKLVVFYVIGFALILLVILLKYSLKSDTSKHQLEEKADTDLLTGLNNKVATERKIKEYIDSHPDEPGMFIIFDIDKFKKINDTQGHAFGDEVLRTLGEQIGSQFRVTDIVGRIGGDEFMIFLKNIPSDEIALKEAEKLMRFFKAFKAGGEYIKYSATASVGVAMYPEDGKNFDSLYKAADNALYFSKENGRNQLNFHNKDLGTITQ